MSTRALIRSVGAALAVAAVVALVFLLWPARLGGWTSYAVVTGTSMEPGLSTGDLVLARVRPDYRVGDAVLYESDLLGTHVLHRVVAVDGGRYTFRGDNRAQADPEHPTEAAILGSVWLTIPSVGSVLSWLAEPVNLAVVAFLVVLVALGGGREVTRRRRRGGEPPPIVAEPESRDGSTVAGAARAVLPPAAIALVAFGLLAVVAWSRPTTQSRAVVGAYAHTGTFAYDARARRGAAYPDGKVETGEPVFVRLSRAVDVAFDYRFVSDRPASVRGEIALDVTLADGLGWQRTLPLADAPFSGPAARIEGRLDLPRLLAILDGVRASTGQDVSQARVTVVPRVSVTGSTRGVPIDRVFAPELAFTLDAVALRLDEPEPVVGSTDGGGETALPAAPLAPRAEGTTTVDVPRSLALGPFALAVERARTLSAVGLMAALAALVAAGLVLGRRLAGTETERIEARYGSRVVPARVTVPEGRWVTELHDVDDLVRLADAYDRVVLRVTEPDGGDAYLVDDGIALYRYRARRPGALGTPRSVPVHGR